MTSDMEPEVEDLELRSDEVQAILTAVPSWMIRWGITLIFAIVVLCLLLSYLIKYPDVINGEIKISTAIPPAKLVAKANGEIEQLFVADNSWVKKGEVIAQIRNPLTEEAINHLVLKVEEVLNGVASGLKDDIAFSPQKLVFGAAQNDYNQMEKLVKEYQYTFDNLQYTKRVNILQKQIGNYKRLNSINNTQMQYSEDNLGYAAEKYESSKVLYEREMLSKVDFYEQEMSYSNMKTEVENLKKNQVQNTITLTDYERQLNELEIEFLTKKQTLLSAIEAHANNVKNEINNWEKVYLLVAPFEGRLTYLDALSENQYITADKPLFAVVPENDQAYIGYITLDKLGYGKVEVGQEVKIKLDNFPSAQFGQVNGVVEHIAIIPNEEKYMVKVNLPNGLNTTYKQTLEYAPEMAGKADIITEDLRILERIFSQFRQLFD